MAAAELLLSALLPAAADGLRTLVGRLSGPGPRTVADAVALQDAQTRRLQALAALDAPAGQIAPWVSNLRASSRYLACGALIANAIGQAALSSDPAAVALSVELGQAAFAFLFGDRVYVNLKSR